MSRISLRDFVFVKAAKAGWARVNFMELIARLEQAAADGKVTLWGRAADSSMLSVIRCEHWLHHQIDGTSIYKSNAEIFSRKRMSSREDREFYDLHLSRKEALRWLRAESSTDWTALWNKALQFVSSVSHKKAPTFTKHYVTFFNPDANFNKEITNEVLSWDVKFAKHRARALVKIGATPYGFYFTERAYSSNDLTSREIKRSSTHWLGGTVWTLAEIKTRGDIAATNYANFLTGGRDNAKGLVVFNAATWKFPQPLSEDDVFVPFGADSEGDE